MVKIKICGLKTGEDIRMANRLKPDFAGFVFADSRRRITPEQAAGMKKELQPEIRSVGVFVNEELERVVSLAESGVLDLIQIHGDEDEAYIRRLKERTEKPVIKAVRVRGQKDILQAVKLPCEYPWILTKRTGTGAAARPFAGTGFRRSRSRSSWQAD